MRPPFSAAEIADRQAITDQIYRYCRSVDRLDVPLGHRVFHPDSHADFGSIYTGSGRGWIDFICRGHRAYTHHSHQVTNILIELDGDRAGSEAYVTATLRQREGDRIHQREFWARYVDTWSRREDHWAIDRRVCLIDFDATREVTEVEPRPDRRDRTDLSYDVLEGPA